MVFVRGMNSHVDRMWRYPRNRRYAEALASAFSLTVYDARGCGLSAQTDIIELDGLVADLAAVVDDIGSPVTLYGQGWGSPIALAFAGRRPDAVTRLILYAAHARGIRVGAGYVRLMRESPGAAAAVMARDSYPDWSSVPSDLMRSDALSMSASTGAAYLEFVRSVDVTKELGRITASTLVLQPETSPAVPFEHGREVAEGIAGAELISIPGGAYNPWTDAAAGPSLEAIGRFCGVGLPTNVPRILTVLSTDIVSSTALAHEVGDVRARELLRVHDSVVRGALRDHGGSEVKHRGDGILATFESVTSAIAAAVRIQRDLFAHRAEVPEAAEVRVGISRGEVFEEEHDVYGTNVVLAVRLSDLADPGQILLAHPLDASEIPAGVELGRTRSVEAKGFPEPVVAYEVAWINSGSASGGLA